ncbi:hypothetical protein Mesau_06014 [Mesorhizobium australicum WSM2073]|uniref:Uncharacterized protein n=1 Tax=Mesorhizobium australicum (strain HAMBI 3006 / LMG 24608 / WSM2073) TaxID=754035 RepID=L0KVY3_MESAW|nr:MULTISPECIES: hypothetical protein [Mesorhizobium]AGB48233.1 hypothetical protein Mesau_06014 [Mesorhizobium australicum WSM2073]TPI22539.1 hypothetical protein FJW10_03690 [Mesorhizobium sp. B4-1-1]
MDTYNKLGHLEDSLVSLNPLRLAGMSRLTLAKIEKARVRHAELLQQLRDLDKQHAAAENSHLQHHISQLIEHLRPQIQHAFDTIAPYRR